jgi:hypothetical protein
MVIYTDHLSVDKLKSICEWRKDKTIIINKPLSETYCAKYINYWNNDWNRDPEKIIHNTNLYIVWNEKSNFVKEAIQNNYFKTDYFCWCDIGCFRTHETISKYRYFPNITKLSSIDKIHLLNIVPFQEKDLDTLKNIKLGRTTMHNFFNQQNRIGGTIFVGHINAWKKWIPLFYSTMELFMTHNTFAGKDQDIMAMIALLYPEVVQLITPPTSNDWFYLQDYFIS